MAVAESLVGASQAASSQELAQSWRRLTRAATAVAVLTSPALFVWFTQQNPRTRGSGPGRHEHFASAVAADVDGCAVALEALLIRSKHRRDALHRRDELVGVAGLPKLRLRGITTPHAAPPSGRHGSNATRGRSPPSP